MMIIEADEPWFQDFCLAELHYMEILWALTFLYTRIIVGAAILLALIWSQEFLMHRQMNIFQKLNRWRTKERQENNGIRKRKQHFVYPEKPWKHTRIFWHTYRHRSRNIHCILGLLVECVLSTHLVVGFFKWIIIYNRSYLWLSMYISDCGWRIKMLKWQVVQGINCSMIHTNG